MMSAARTGFVELKIIVVVIVILLDCFFTFFLFFFVFPVFCIICSNMFFSKADLFNWVWVGRAQATCLCTMYLNYQLYDANSYW